MATTDTRSGFRLPWSSDRTNGDSDQSDPLASATEDSAATVEDAAAPAWPDSDFSKRLGVTPPAPRPAEEPVMTQPDGAHALTPPPARRPPTKLMADLAAAILATTEVARDTALSTVEADATKVTEAIRAASTIGVEALRRQSDGDLAAIKDWSKAEIARIREEAEARIEARKGALATEIAAHAAAVDYRVEEVQDAVDRYRAAMDTYFERLKTEDDPSHLATLAEAMPEPPALEALADLADLDVAAFVQADVAEPEPTVAEAAVESEAIEAAAGVAEADAEAAVEAGVADGVVEIAPVAEFEAEQLSDDGSAELEIEAEVVEVEVEPVEAETKPAMAAWIMEDNTWGRPAAAETADTDGNDVPRWAAGETPDGFPASVEGGDPVDRGAIMAALEAAAEAVVAAESAAESADQAEAAADVAETAAELLVGRHETDEESEDAKAALSARVDAGGFETESFANRLASLMPGHGDAASDGEPRTTQVVVTGLVSVASIASFKRHLGRLPGVHTVGVASGPEGEFLFNVGHRPDVSFRDVIPSMPGFAARVTGMSDGIVTVSARDPESEG